MSERQPIRVWHFGPGGVRGRGGMGRFLAYLIPALNRQNLDLTCRVIDTYGPGAFWQMPFWFAGAVWSLIWGALRRRVDAVHVHMAAYGSIPRKMLLAMLGGAFRLPTVVHMHGADLVEFVDRLPRFVKNIFINSLKKVTIIVVIGEYWRYYMTRDLDIPADRVAVVHNGVPDPRKSAAFAGQTLERADHRLLSLGELGPRKGTPELLAALAAPRLLALSWSAIVAGNGPVEECREQVRRLGLADRVELPGWIESAQAWRLLAESGVFVLPSRMEGLPVAILEAMAMGAAVVTTPVGAIADAIEDGVTGLLVPPGDAPALADAIARLLEEPGLRAGLADAARRRFEMQFTIERTAEQVAALYRRIVVRRE
jgi:glycosyltransferase involved in cell wall biosynthesis